MTTLGDLYGMSATQLKEHIIEHYADDNESRVALKKELKGFSIIVAYESVGSWGCDSSSFFLLRNKKTKELFVVHGSHCSCYGFEGQFGLEPTTIEALKMSINKGKLFYTGGYDDESKLNYDTATKRVLRLKS